MTAFLTIEHGGELMYTALAVSKLKSQPVSLPRWNSIVSFLVKRVLCELTRKWSQA